MEKGKAVETKICSYLGFTAAETILTLISLARLCTAASGDVCPPALVDSGLEGDVAALIAGAGAGGDAD